MRLRASGTLSLRLWLALALVVIVGAPALTTWALSTALTPRVPPGVASTVATVRGLLGNDAAHWHNPGWQRRARQRLAALHADVLLLDGTTGQPVFATSGVSPLLPWGVAYAGALPPVPARRTRGAAYRPPPPRLVLTLPLSTPPLPQRRQAGAASVRVTRAFVLAGIAYVWLPPSTAVASPPAWLVPLAGLAALLVALAAVAWGLGHLVLRPLADMRNAADQIAGGDLDVWLPPSRAGEVAEVAAALEGMSASLQAALRRQAALEEERRLFIGAIAHDLHTPLFVLRGYLQGLENGVVTAPSKVAAYAAECRARVDALARLIADLFAYTKVEYLDQAIQPERLDLGELVRQSLAGVQPLAAEKGLTVTLDGPAAPCPLLGDRHLLARALENLVDNALRYTPSGGVVRVSWGVEGQKLVLRVADTGPGLAAHDLANLFNPLYRGEASRNRQTGGVGLGLTIARRILQAHGGEVTAANGVAGGAVFTVTLPLDQPAPTPTSDPKVPAQ